MTDLNQSAEMAELGAGIRGKSLRAILLAAGGKDLCQEVPVVEGSAKAGNKIQT